RAPHGRARVRPHPLGPPPAPRRGPRGHRPHRAHDPQRGRGSPRAPRLDRGGDACRGRAGRRRGGGAQGWMTRLLLVAVVVLVAVAAADAIRPDGEERTVSAAPGRPAAHPAVHRSSSGYVAAVAFTRKRVLHHGREYLSSDAIDAAFPSLESGEPFDI